MTKRSQPSPNPAWIPSTAIKDGWQVSQHLHGGEYEIVFTSKRQSEALEYARSAADALALDLGGQVTEQPNDVLCVFADNILAGSFMTSVHYTVRKS